MGNKGGGGRVGYGTASSKGPKKLGGKSGAGGKIRGGGTRAALERATGGSPKGKTVSLSLFRRQAGLTQAEAVAEADRLVASGQAEYAYASDKVAATLRENGQHVDERGGRPVRGIKITGTLA